MIRGRLSGAGRAFAALLAFVVLLPATPADAHWAAAGWATGSAATGTLAAPTGVTVPQFSLPSVAVSWTASAGSPTPTGYYVTRTSGGTTTAACASSAAALLATTSCTDTAVPAGTYTYRVVAAWRSWTATAVAASDVTVLTPTQVAFTVQPAGSVAGATMSPAVAVTVRDAGGAPVTVAGIGVAVAFGTNAGGGTLSGTLTGSTDANGVATFANLSVDKAAAGYTLAATSSDLTGATSSAFTVTAAAASRFALTSSPVSGTAGTTATLGPLTVARQDPYGNLSVAPGGGTVVSLASDSAGTAVFSATSGGAPVASVTIPAGSSSTTFYYGDTKSGTPTITASGSLTSATQSATVNPGTATTFAVTSVALSGSAAATATLGPATVERRDAFGNPSPAPGGGTAVTLASNSAGTAVFAASSGGTPTSTVTIAAGSASTTFWYGDTKAGTPTLTASGSLTSATQDATISPAAASTFAITSAPVSGTASASATLGALTVVRLDPFGNAVVAPAGGTTVTLGSNSTGTAVFSATSGGATTTTVTIPAGSSSTTFYYGDTKAGAPTITASGSLTSATQGATITAGTATKLGFGQQPTNTAQGSSITPAVAAQVQDQFGNVTTSTASVTVAIDTNGGLLNVGVLNGTTTRSAVAGVGTFTGLNITAALGLHLAAGNGYTLKITSAGLTQAISTPFNIT